MRFYGDTAATTYLINLNKNLSSHTHEIIFRLVKPKIGVSGDKILSIAIKITNTA